MYVAWYGLMITKSSRNRKMVEVFKTNVEQIEQSQWLINQIVRHIPNGTVNFDLEDCDKILRVEAESISNRTIIDLLNKNGFHAEVLS